MIAEARWHLSTGRAPVLTIYNSTEEALTAAAAF